MALELSGEASRFYTLIGIHENPNGCCVRYHAHASCNTFNSICVLPYSSSQMECLIAYYMKGHIYYFCRKNNENYPMGLMQASGEIPTFWNLIHPCPPSHLVYNAHLIPNCLSFHMSLSVVMNCGAGSALHGFKWVCFFFFKLYFKHISTYTLLLRAQNATKQC